jgi:phage gp36-like protein
MPRYLTRPELLARRRQEQLAHLARGEDGQLDVDRIDQAIDAAEGEVTSWLGPRYGDDLPTVPAAASEALKTYTADLVPYHLAKGSAAVPEQVLLEYRETRSMLRAIALGTAVLDLPAKPATDSSRPVVAALRPASDAGLTLDTLRDW